MPKVFAASCFGIAIYLILKGWFHYSENFSMGWAGLIAGILFFYFCLHEADKERIADNKKQKKQKNW